MPTRPPRRLALTRTQVHNAFGKLQPRLKAGVADLARKLLDQLDEDGTVTKAKLYDALFPVADAKTASAQTSKLLKALKQAASDAGMDIADKLSGSRQQGKDNMRLGFTGPAPTLRHDAEGLNALPSDQVIAGQRGLPLLDEKRIVLLTFNDHEFSAVINAFRPGMPPKLTPVNDVAVFPLGQHSGVALLLRHSPQGSLEAQRTVHELSVKLQPLAVVAVGIAFGLDEKKQALADVLVSTFIRNCDFGKVHADGNYTLRGPTPPASRRWVEAARQVDLERSKAADQGTWPKLRLGGVLSGEKLIDNLNYRDRLVKLTGQDDYVGGEMEGAGLQMALDGSGIDWIVIKAICDWADGNKAHDKDKRQQRAADNAATVVKAIVDSGLVSYGGFGHSEGASSTQPRADTALCEPTAARARGRLRAHLPDFEALRELSAAVDGRALEVELETLKLDRPESQPSQDRPTVEVLQDVLNWAGDEQGRPLYALLGEYGMGKTTTCQRAAQRLHEQREAGAAVRVPLYFDLRKVERLLPASDTSPGRVPTLRETIEDCLRHGYLHEGGEPPRYEDVLEQLEQGAVVFLDGLDEVLSRLGEKQGLTFTANLLRIIPEAQQRGAPAPRVLLSCRTQFFRNLAEQNNHLTGEHRGARPAAQYRAMTLLPFDDEQIRSYLCAVFPGSDAQELLDRIAEVHNLRELAQRPFTLKLVAQFLPQIDQWRAQGRTVTGATLYREVAREWLIRDKEKQSFKPEIKERLASDLAAHLWRHNLRGLKANELDNWLGRWLAAQDATADFQSKSIDLLQEDLRNSTFLKRVDGGKPQDSYFEFAHTSLLEFFLADHLFRALQAVEPDRHNWALSKPSDETLDFLGQMLAEEPDLLQVLGRWRKPYLKGASELLLAYALRAYRRGWPMPPLEALDLRGAGLNDWYFGNADEEVTGTSAPLDMRHADFTGAHLRRSRFWHVDLRGARFEGAALTQAEFLCSTLEQASWSGADLAGTVFRPLSERPMATPTAAVRARLALVSSHGSIIAACAFSPDGRWLASAGGDSTLRLWDVTSGESLRAFQGHQGSLWACAFSPDGRWLVSAGVDRTLRLWDAASGELLRVFRGHEGSVWACTFAPDGRWLASAGEDRTLRLWDVTSGESLRVYKGSDGSVRACAFSPDGRWLASAGNNGTLRLRDAVSGESLRVFRGHQGSVRACAFSPDGRWLASAGSDSTLRLWDADSGELLRVFQGHEDSVRACAFSPDGRWVASAGDDGTLRLWDSASGESLRVFQGRQRSVRACTFSPDGRWLVSAGVDRTLRLRDAASGESLRVFQGHQRSVRACTFSPDGRWLASAANDGTVRLWDGASGKSLRVFQGHQRLVSACSFSPDGRWLASAGGDSTLRLWDAASGESLRAFQGHQGSLWACAFSPDGRWLASAGGDSTLRLWDAASGELLRVFQGHEGSVWACTFTPDGRWLASAGEDRTLRLWDAASGESLRVFRGHHSSARACAFSPDGRWLASAGSDSTLRLWDAASGESLRVLKGHQGSVWACALSPDGRWLASAGDDSTLRLWDADSGELLRVFQGHEDSVWACAFSPDGRWLASAGADGTLRLWDAASGEPLRIHLHVAKGAAAWQPRENQILYASGRAWRYLRWQGQDPETGDPAAWPLECPPPGVEVKVLRWNPN